MFRSSVVALIVFFFFTGCTGKPKEELFKEGLTLLNENNPRGSIVLFKNALEKDQNFFEARFQLAKAYLATGKYERAEKEFLKVLRQTPSRGDIHLELARVYIYTRKPDRAIDEVKKYLKSNPDDPEALEIMGRGYAIKGKVVDAERYFLKTLEADPANISAKLGLAGVYRTKGSEGRARILLDEIFEKDKDNINAYYMLANLETTTGNRDKALIAYKRITEIDPSDTNALFRTGLLHIDKEELKEAEKIAEETIERFPKRPEGYRLKGIASFYRESFSDSIIALQISANIQPDKSTYYFLGLSHYKMKEPEQALSQFNRALDFAPSFIQARLMIAMILLKQGRVDDSILETKRVLQLDERNALAHNLLGSAYMAKEMYDEGMEELNRAIEIDPELVDAHIKKGLFNLGKGRFKEAETELKTAVRVAPGILNTRLVLASYYIKRKEYERAVNILKKAVKGDKTDAVLYNYIAVALMAEKKFADAVTYLQKAKDANPGYFAPYFNIAAYHTVKGDYEKALDEYKAVISRDPGSPKALINMALILELSGREKESLSYYRKAKETKTTAGFIALTNYLIRKKEVGKAIATLDEAIQADPRNTTVLELKGKIYLTAKRYKDAIRIFEDLEAINPGKGLPLIINTYIQRRDYKKALKVLKNKLKAYPERLDLMAKVSGVYALMGKTREAVENANKIIKQQPDSAFGYIVLSSVYENNNLDRAIDVLKEGLKVEDGNIRAKMMIGNLYIKKGEYAFAMDNFEDIVKANPRYIPAIFAQGTIYDRLDKKKEAVKKYSQVLEKTEKYVPALNNLAYLYAEGFGSKKEALELALKAYRLAPANAGVVDTLGYILLKNGRTDEAIKVLEKAVSLLPDNPTVHYHLALAYIKSGNPDVAREHLEKALTKGSFPEAKRARILLREGRE